MRVGIDLQLAHGTATGIGEYALGLLAALHAHESGRVEAVALESAAFDPWRFDRRVLWDQVALPLEAARARVDLVHCVSGTMPLFAPVPQVVTVHDVAWLRVQAHARPYARAYFGAFSLLRYRRARRIFVDSNFSRRELLDVARLDPARLVVAYPGVAADVGTIVRARDDDAPFVLAAGTVEPRKNLELLVRALPSLPRVRLVSVGPHTPYAVRCKALAAELGVEARFELRGYVPRAELLNLYAHASLAAVPSTYEGFGYGAAQALCAGAPLVSSDASSLPEVVGDAAPLLDPRDLDAWIGAMRAIIDDPGGAERRASSVRAAAVERFAWRTTARIVADVYRDVLLQKAGD